MYQQLKNPFTIKCRRCKKDIVLDHANRRFCSLCKKEKFKEYQKNYNVKRRPREYILFCLFCKLTFNANHRGTKYCSNECYKNEIKLRRYNKIIAKYQRKIQWLENSVKTNV